MSYLLAILASAAFTTSVPITSNTTNSTCDPRASADPGPGVEHHEVVEDGTYLWPYQAFKSSPLHPPVMEINTTSNASLAPGLIYITIGDTTPLPVTKRPSPKIMTDQGQLVWSGPESNATNFKWQLYNGRPTLTYWSGLTTSGANIGHGYGNITFLDETYNVTSVLCPKFDNYNTAGDGTFACESDIHESYLTDRGTMIVSAYNATQTDLTSVGGPADGWIWDSQFYELNTTTAEVIFRWSPIEHVPVNKTFMPITTNGNSTSPFDYLHLNSVVNIGSDYYLANSRHTWTIYLISKSTGEIIWEFNGNDGGDFEITAEDFIHFSWQHFVRPHNITFESFDVSIYNNNNYSPQEPHVDATDLLVYTLPIPSSNSSADMKATLKSRIQTSKPLYDDSQGSYFPQLSNGNSFADFGQLPILKEFDPEGKEIWSAQLGISNLAQIYRGFKLDGWVGKPYYKPDLVVEGDKGYVSWNGATDVEGWNVYVSKGDEGKMDLVGMSGYRGFETMFDVPCWAKYVQVGAVEKGKEVRRSEVVEVMSLMIRR